MTIAQTQESTRRKPLRLWPGVAAALLLLLARFVVPIVVPEALFFGVLAGLVGGLAVVLWWVFFSRAPWSERLGAVALMIVALVATPPILHESIRNGMMGMMFVISAIPLLSLAFVAWAVASHRLADGPRRATMVATILLACGAWALVRTDGITGDGASQLAWRWTPTPEQRLLAEAVDQPADATRVEPLDAARPASTALPPAPAATELPNDAPAPKAGDEPAALAPAAAADEPLDSARGGPAAVTAVPAAAKTGADWPGFRGPRRDSIIPGVRVDTNWAASPPVELWRRAIGPGWSSFAVRSDLLYTQEQRGEDEIVACYRVSTGELVWRHRDAARFWESNGGAGPRGTPTLSHGRVYTFGATGILNALDAATGSVVWSRNAALDVGVKVPGWGFASSPLVVGGLVIVATSGVLAAYDPATGDSRWVGRAAGGGSYSSPHLVTIDGVTQILLMAGGGLRSVAPADGTLLWEHPWPGAPIVQPALLADGDVLISTAGVSGALGMRRIAVAHGPGGWTVEERWTSNRLKPYFNDLVVHKGHAYGFDGFIMASLDLSDGTRNWKGGRYGHGQLVLLPDQDLLLVLSEEGELALVAATPDKFTELARVPALEGKTWNHPVLVGDILLVRNGEEMAAFKLSLAGR
jgi:outer membrane protein assembly factor BamB